MRNLPHGRELDNGSDDVPCKEHQLRPISPMSVDAAYRYTTIGIASVFGFVITTLAIIVAVFAVIGAVAIVNTWNDITAKSEAMVKEQVDKYTEEQAKLMEERKKMLQEAKEDFLTVIDKA